MTNKRDDVTLDRLELVLLARYAGSKIPDEDTVNQEVLDLVHGASPPKDAKEKMIRARTTLRSRALLDIRAGKRASPQGPLRLTLAGEQTLRSAFSLASSQTLTWAKVRDACLPMLGLGLRPGSVEATTAQRTLATLMIETLHVEHKLPRAPTVNAVCDAMITEALGLPAGPISSLESLRARFLARKTGQRSAEGTPLTLAKRIVAPHAKEPLTKSELNKLLSRRWLNGQTDHGVLGASAPPAGNTPTPPQPPPITPPAAPTPEALLKAVRELLPQIGADGRYGTEKVFVSALWRNLQQTRRVNGGLTIDNFKQWLLTANRHGELVLARADLVGAMDSKLVADSEIRDHGATFHFVLDRRAPAQLSDRRPHAR